MCREILHINELKTLVPAYKPHPKFQTFFFLEKSAAYTRVNTVYAICRGLLQKQESDYTCASVVFRYNQTVMADRKRWNAALKIKISFDIV